MTDVPHFSLPFRFATPQAAVTEQDSIDEIADCALAVMLCPLGFRVELPEFGMPDQTFSSPAPDLDEIRAYVEQWEPRAGLTLSEQADKLDQLMQYVETFVRVRTEE